MDKNQLEELGPELGEVINRQNSKELVSFFQAIILKRRGDLNPSKEAFSLSRIIANGMAWGFRMGQANPELNIQELEEAVKTAQQGEEDDAM